MYDRGYEEIVLLQRFRDTQEKSIGYVTLLQFRVYSTLYILWIRLFRGACVVTMCIQNEL